MPKVSGNDLVVQTLKNEGVDTVFYLTGGPMSDVAGLCLEMQFKSIDVRHEQAAAMMAHAYSRLTGKPGICFAASGPGTTNPAAEEIHEDQARGRQEYMLQYAWKIGHVAVRELADHAPVNYVSGIIGRIP